MAHQPHNLVATAVSTTEISLSWDDVDTLTDETYDIERDSVIVEASWAGGTTYTDTGLNPDTEYTYRVRAVGGTVPSAPVVTPAAVAARAAIFTPAITVVADAAVTQTTVSAVAVVFVPSVATTVSTVTPTTVVGAASIEVPTITGETYSDSYGLGYGETGGNVDVALTTVVTASTVVTPTISTLIVPTDIAGLRNWYDASTIGLSDGAAVASWSDSSASGYTLSQGTGVSQPTYETNELNGLPVVRFDGSNDYLTSGTMTAWGTALTIFVVAKENVASGSYKRFFSMANSGATLGQLYHNITTNVFGWYQNQAAGLNPFTGASDQSFAVLSIVFASMSSATAYYNGTSVATFDPAAFDTQTRLTVGATISGTDAGAVDFAELIIYDSALSDPDRIDVQDYLADKYGL